MYKGKSFLAIIPARGGSKRLPRKNILPLNGKPLIVWTIEAALQCKLIDKILVTSDDDEILSIANQCGADIMKRPGQLAQDASTSFDAIEHAIENSGRYEFIVLLQPTSPLRTAKHIEESIYLLESKKADAVISVTEMGISPLWANTLPENMSMSGFLAGEVLNLRSQDLEKHYRLNGAIYICRTKNFLEESTFFLREKIYAYVMDGRSSVDIDTRLDFEWAEFLCRKGLQNIKYIKNEKL